MQTTKWYFMPQQKVKTFTCMELHLFQQGHMILETICQNLQCRLVNYRTGNI